MGRARRPFRSANMLAGRGRGGGEYASSENAKLEAVPPVRVRRDASVRASCSANLRAHRVYSQRRAWGDPSPPERDRHRCTSMVAWRWVTNHSHLTSCFRTVPWVPSEGPRNHSEGPPGTWCSLPFGRGPAYPRVFYVMEIVVSDNGCYDRINGSGI